MGGRMGKEVFLEFHLLLVRGRLRLLLLLIHAFIES